MLPTSEIPFAAIDVLATKMADLDATDEVVLGRDIMQGLSEVQRWLDAQPNVVTARRWKMQLQHSINTNRGD